MAVKRKSPVSHRLRQARNAAGLSQKMLGIKAGIDEFSASARINQYERDKHVPNFSTAKRLAVALNIPVTYLFTDDDELAEFVLMYSLLDNRKRAKIKDLLKAHSN